MKPQNQKERNLLFFQFFLLYISTNVLVGLAVWFNCEIKDKEIATMQSQLETYKKADELPKSMNENVQLLDSLIELFVDPDKSDMEQELEDDITRILNSMPVLGMGNHESIDSLCNKIRKNYYIILHDKKMLKTAQLSVGLAGNMDKENKVLKTELMECKTKNEILNLRLNNPIKE